MAKQLPYKGKRGRVRQKSTGQSQLTSFENGRNHSLEQVDSYARFFYPDSENTNYSERREGIIKLFETALSSSENIDISSLPQRLRNILAKLAAAFILYTDIAEKYEKPDSADTLTNKGELMKMESYINGYTDYLKNVKISYKNQEF
jgi:hypothetical protein